MEDDNAWVFDSLVCFLNGPIWNAPLQSFIEEKSLIFEPSLNDSDEYKLIFDEFKNLVDFMLGNLMEDIGITPQQFEEACNKGSHYPVNFNHNIFEQIWAANDYEMFKRMMTQRNIELQLQALELIEQKYGITPQSFIPDKKGHVDTSVAEEKPNSEENIMNEVAKDFPKTEGETSSENVKYILEEKKQLEKSLKATKAKTGTLSQQQKEAPKENTSESDGGKSQMPTDAELGFDKKPIKSEINSIELKKRQEYLRAQRDKLVALKKEVRKKHLNAESSGSKDKSVGRPKSAKAAEAVLAGEKTTIEANQLQIRKALAERLKSEVVSQKK